MKRSTRSIAAVLLCGTWVNASEFLRNEVLLKEHWTRHYAALGLRFPSAPHNAALWVAWGFLYAGALYLLSRRFPLAGAALVGWLTGFVLMWVVAWNLDVLPASLLPFAVPLSLVEAFVGV